MYLSPLRHAITDGEEDPTEDSNFEDEEEECDEAYDPSPEGGFINSLKQRELRARDALDGREQQAEEDEYDIDVDVDNIDEADDDDY